jgi:hypothetical protein
MTPPEPSPIIAAIEAEREQLRKRLGELDELEAHARRVLGGEAPPQPKPERKPKPKARKAAKNPEPKRESKATVEASVLRELGKGTATSAALQEATGRPQATVDAVLRKLFAKGKVHHDDATPRVWALMPQVHRDNGNGERPREDWPHTEKQVRAQAVSEDQREEEREGNVKRRREGAPRGGTMLPPEPQPDEQPPPAETNESQDGAGDGDEAVAYTERRLRRLFSRTPATFDEAVAAIDAPRDTAETALATLVAAGDVSKMQDGRYCA